MSYKAGIVAAIAELDDRTGSSSIAIKKHMQANLPRDKKWLNGMFLNALKKAVAGGDLVRIKSSYKLSSEFKKSSYKLSPEFKKKSTVAAKLKKAPKKTKVVPKRKKTAPKKKAVLKKKKVSKKKAAAKKKIATKKKHVVKETATKKASKK